MKFLKDWTIDLSKLPKYKDFTKHEFKEPLDTQLMGILLEKTNDYPPLCLTMMKNHIYDPMIRRKAVIHSVRYNQPFEMGRFYSNSMSITEHKKKIKHTLMSYSGWIDLDQKKGHPRIALEIAKKNGIPLNAIEEYVNDASKQFEEMYEWYGIERTPKGEGICKDYFNMTLYGGGHSTWIKDLENPSDEKIALGKVPIKLKTHEMRPFEKAFKADAVLICSVINAKNPEIRKRLLGSDEYKKKTEYQIDNSVASYWFGIIENHSLHIAYTHLVKNNLIKNRSCSLEKDGLCFKPANDNFDKKVLCGEINRLMTNEMGMNITYEFKPYKPANIDSDAICQRNKLTDVGDEYTEMKKEFETNHTKIVNLGIFMKTEQDKDIPMSKIHLQTAYEHMRHTIQVGDKEVDTAFTMSWLKDPTIKMKRDIGIYPHDQVCPDDIYNAWRPFKMEEVDTYIKNDKAVDFMKNHIQILCDRNDDCYNYFIKWIAMLIQFPSIKLPMPVFVSGEGAGKGSIIRLFEGMLGSSKILQTQEPSKDVWGQFNGQMLNGCVVVLDECCRKEMCGSEGKIKGLITEPTIIINEKGKPSFSVDSYHHFIATANPDEYGNEPMKTTADDRRKFFMMCSDELIGNRAYFEDFYEFLDDENAMKTIYEYFKQMPNAKSILKSPLPQSDYHNELKEVSTSPLKLFLIDLITNELDDERTQIEMTSAEMYKQFKQFCQNSGIRYECSLVQFGCRIKNLRLEGMRKRRMGRMKIAGWMIDEDIIQSLGLGK
jgi:hypothetical protein